MKLSTLANYISGQLVGADGEFSGAAQDTRKFPPGALYVALKGEHFDGHDFLAAARESGAAGALVARVINDPLPQIVVADPKAALIELARLRRAQFSGPVVAITGSNGKTTVKEMTRAILQQISPTLATRGNLNNDIGVPLTLSWLDIDLYRSAVIEMGANHPGEIAQLAKWVQPTVAVVNNAGPAHLAGFGTVAGVARAKGEIYGALSPEGVAVINADDPHNALWRELAADRRVIDFGIDNPAVIGGEIISLGAQVRFHLITPAGSAEISLPLPGRHNVLNALAASAAAFSAGATLTAICAGLTAVEGVIGRLRPVPGRNGAHLIDDTYNANPASLRAALEVLATHPGTRCLALGDMGELGPNAAQFHAEIGALARQFGIEMLFACGNLSQAAVAAFGSGATHYANYKDLSAALIPYLQPHLTILIKGSRSAGMERVVHILTEN